MKHAAPQQSPLAHPVPRFSELMGWSRSFTYKLMKDGKLRTIKVRGRRLVPASEADRLLKEEV